MKRGQETNHIWKQEAGTQNIHDRGLTHVAVISIIRVSSYEQNSEQLQV